MRYRWACALWALVGLGCGSPEATAAEPAGPERSLYVAEPTARPSPRLQPVGPEASGPVIPRCGSAEGQPLTTYGGLVSADGALHHTAVRYRDRVWAPAAPVDMPTHHATSLQWTNLADFARLANAEEEELRFTFTVLSRTRQHRAAENLVFVTIRARIEQLCSSSAPAERPEGALLGAIGLDTSACVEREASIRAAAEALGACTRDDECAIVDVDACDIEGLGCHWVAAHRGRSRAELDAALTAHAVEPCPRSSCDCETPPTEARCRSGQCVGHRL